MSPLKYLLPPIVACALFSAPVPAWELEGLVVESGYSTDRDLGPSWSSHGGVLRMDFNRDLLGDLGFELSVSGAESGPGGQLIWNIHPDSALEFKVRAGVSVERFAAGRWVTQGGFVLRHGDTEYGFQNMVLRPSEYAPHVLEIRNAAGELMFFVDHIHAMVDPDSQRITMKNMDLRLSPGFAQRIGEARHAGLTIGMMRIDGTVHIPAGAQLGPEPDTISGLSCSGRPVWPGTPDTVADVRLIAIGQVSQMRRNASTGEVVVAPSATLKNRGGADAADIPWWRQFTGPNPPYGNDQHPFLVWGMYRIKDGRIEQIGRSGVKHAFLTINTNCDINCGSGNILWPGCEDVYGTSNNDSATYMGPIDEIEAFEGIWDSCNSFFDPNCVGNQTQSSTGGYLNRMVVQDEDMNQSLHPGAQYVFQAWYVVRDDVNIYNTMGYRTLNPQFGGSTWSFGPLGSFSTGPVVDQFVASDSMGSSSANQRIVAAQGHAGLVVNVIELDGGLYRYEYALQNHDIDLGIDSLRIPLQAGVNVLETGFRRASASGSGEWAAQVDANAVTWAEPDASARQPWASLFNFWMVTNSPPEAGQARIGVAGGDKYDIATLVPSGNDVIFINGFEAQP